MSPRAGERAAERKAEWDRRRAGRDVGERASRLTEQQRPPQSDRARGRPGVERGAGRPSRGGRREPGLGLAGAASLVLAATRQRRPLRPRPHRGLHAEPRLPGRRGLRTPGSRKRKDAGLRPGRGCCLPGPWSPGIPISPDDSGRNDELTFSVGKKTLNSKSRHHKPGVTDFIK